MLHVRPASGALFQVDLGCEDFAVPIADTRGAFDFCHRAGDPFPELHHWDLIASAQVFLVNHTEVTPLDDFGDAAAIEVFGPSSATGGVAFILHRVIAGEPSELFAADRRIYLGSFEPGTTAGWSATVP